MSLRAPPSDNFQTSALGRVAKAFRAGSFGLNEQVQGRFIRPCPEL